jgi:hypothetical protein
MAGRLAVVTVLGAVSLLHARPCRASDPDTPTEAEEAREVEEEDDPGDVLRERLTEREDKRRPAEPFEVDLLGRPLVVGGEYEIELLPTRRRLVGDDGGANRDRLLLAQGLEVEAFYSFGTPLSLFAQVRGAWEKDLLPETFEEVSDLFVERGEMWLYSERIGGTRFSADVGRLDFEDDRRWWWDEELDAARLLYEADDWEIAVALAYELGPARSGFDAVEPDHDRVLRVIGEASFDWRDGHSAQLFLLHASDRSSREAIGEVVAVEEEDDSDATLTWIGARATGIAALRRGGHLGYWLDTAFVAGEEEVAEIEPVSRSRSAVVGRGRSDVRGFAIDAGIEWFPEARLEPRFFAGYAIGSGDSDPGSGGDHSFQQTRLEANEAGFGGVERYAQYGFALDPELSNLGVLTLGAGIALGRSSSLDLVYHHYVQLAPADELRDAALELEPTGRSRGVGQGLDLVLAIEEWERFELELIGSAFRGGRALGDEQGSFSAAGLVALRIAF